MFERYTEKARRVIFFARYEASQYGSHSIETEHMLLGLLREDNSLRLRLLAQPRAAESIRKEIESQITRGERVSTSIDMPVSSECRQALNFALEEAERFAHKMVGTEHLLLGLLRVEKSMAATILAAHQVTLAGFQEFLESEGARKPPAMHSADTVKRSSAAEPVVILQSFLEALRAGLQEDSASFFGEDAQYIDECGRCSTGREELLSRLGELFAPFAAKNAKYVVEDTIRPSEGMCVASLLWEDVPFAGKTPKGLCRMTVALGHRGSPLGRWAIYAIQVTPVTRL